MNLPMMNRAIAEAHAWADICEQIRLMRAGGKLHSHYWIRREGDARFGHLWVVRVKA